ncbi:MAG: endolytic transglycosylase MltG [Lachnospiraceae bacterium]|nr:endolytic transglycosylase MltG [Lachnospiraceae bacterium]MDD7147723.1 endolytic transglycosylase MltG [Lachnospiraceae bacterium]MDY4069975.1 endolytic transglycosylase MltG [Lachnospiraceae bacterium]
MEGRQIAGAVVGTVIKVVVTAVFLMFVYRYAVEAYDYGYRIFGEEPMDAEPGRDVTVTIEEHDSTQDVAEMLMQRGLIRDAKLFVIQEKLSGLEEGIQPGTYDLNTAMKVEEMLEIFAAGNGETETEGME